MYEQLGHYKVSGEHLVLSHRLYRNLLHVIRLQPSKALGPSRGIDKLVDLLKVMIGETPGGEIDSNFVNMCSSSTVAHDINVDSAALPDFAGTVRPEHLLDPDKAQEFLDSDKRVLDPPPSGMCFLLHAIK